MTVALNHGRTGWQCACRALMQRVRRVSAGERSSVLNSWGAPVRRPSARCRDDPVGNASRVLNAYFRDMQMNGEYATLDEDGNIAITNTFTFIINSF